MLGLSKHTHAKVTGVRGNRILKVLCPTEADQRLYPDDKVLPWDAATNAGRSGCVSLSEPRDPGVIQAGDVIAVREGSSLVTVLYRRGSRSNALFATERCNSLCVMCSQPPRDDNDDWRIRQMLDVVALVDPDEPQLGITGGEPTLLGEGLVQVLKAARERLPLTHLHVLTNGRLFGNPGLAEAFVAAGGEQTTWAVPLYADGPERHDEVVGAQGAYAETLLGLAELAKHGARVELRVVLHRLTIPRLKQLAAFIYRRLPFVEHVALMGLEPMGFAKANRERLWIDPADYVGELEAAARHLADRGLNVSIYNLPLCVLPQTLWPFARKSISDWKNQFPSDCQPCDLKARCSGFFASAGPTWRSRQVRPILQGELQHELA